MELTGRVQRAPIARGSKSERTGVVLSTAQGDYILRRSGGNPFHDDFLESLVGRDVRCEGIILPGSVFQAVKLEEEGGA
jgi:hypothetical protein